MRTHAILALTSPPGILLPIACVSHSCLSAHSDIVPDGEGGWVLDWLGVAAVVLYLGGGVAMGTARGNNR